MSQRIEPRGPRDTLVFVPTMLPLKDVIDELIECRSIARITAKWPITVDEVYEAMEVWCDTARFSKYDILEFDKIDRICLDSADVNVTRISDVIYINILNYCVNKHGMGEFDHDNDHTIDSLFTDGLYILVKEICEDFSYNRGFLESSDLHSMVYEAFTEAYNGDFIEDHQWILECLEASYEERAEREAWTN